MHAYNGQQIISEENSYGIHLVFVFSFLDHETSKKSNHFQLYVVWSDSFKQTLMRITD